MSEVITQICKIEGGHLKSIANMFAQIGSPYNDQSFSYLAAASRQNEYHVAFALLLTVIFRATTLLGTT